MQREGKEGGVRWKRGRGRRGEMKRRRRERVRGEKETSSAMAFPTRYRECYHSSPKLMTPQTRAK